MYTVTFEMTRDDVMEIISVLNEYQSTNITIEEVEKNPELLKYICEMDFKDYTMTDLVEYWNQDGWADVEDYRVPLSKKKISKKKKGK